MTDVPCALGLARKPAGFRQQPEDFIVTEMLGFELTGDGEHLWLEVEKTGLNTVDVARQLASLAGVKERDVAYAGLKDRHAVATQWFSLPGKSVAQLPETEQSGWRILRQVRNSRKLGRGSHRGNRFVITLRDVMIAPDELGHWQRELTTTGCPNYFGPQRFGHDGGNLDKAKALFAGTLKAGRHQRGLYLSAARSWLFNQVLAQRVSDGTWHRQIAGDVMALSGSASVFRAETDDATLTARLASGDIHPTGPLWGRGDLPTAADAARLESRIAGTLAEFSAGLAVAGMTQERRPLRVIPEALTLAMPEAGQLVATFSLPRGAFATSVLREMVQAAGL